jgi:uncharacterized protein (DUF849 family)
MIYKPFVLNFVPTGMVPTKVMNSNVPLSPHEIVEQVHEANEIGITLVHLHARDEFGVPTYKAEIYEKIVNGLRKCCPDLVICVSLSGRNFSEFSQRSEALELDVDMGSLTLSSMNFADQPSINSTEMIMALCTKMNERGIHPELEVFDLGMINYGKYLIRKGLIKNPLYFNIILGNIAGLQLNFSQIGNVVNDLPENALWSLGGIGTIQLAANTLSIAMGGGVRVGLEDNLYFDQGKKVLATNIDLIKRTHQIANEFERPLLTSKEFGNLGFYNNNRQ